MPALSLWLLPPATHPLTSTLSTLISHTIPSLLPSSSPSKNPPPKFSPHVTLASGIPASKFANEEAAKRWLARLEIPQTEAVRVRFEKMEVGTEFFKKVTVRVRKEEGTAAKGLRKLALVCRKEGVEDGDEEKAAEWVRRTWAPHCSLLYSDLEIDSATAAKMEQAVRDAGIEFVGDGEGSGKEMNGWDGGRVWLVDTQKGVEEWKPIAERVL